MTLDEYYAHKTVLVDHQRDTHAATSASVAALAGVTGSADLKAMGLTTTVAVVEWTKLKNLRSADAALRDVVDNS